MLLHPETLPTTVPGVRLVRYVGPAAVRAVGAELSHLDRLGGASDAHGHSAWLDGTVGHDGLSAVTISRDGHLVGYAAGAVEDTIVVLDRLVIVPAVRVHHPELLEVLVEGFLDAAGLPWADVAVPAGSAAVAALLARRWQVVEQRGEHVVLHGADAH